MRTSKETFFRRSTPPSLVFIAFIFSEIRRGGGGGVRGRGGPPGRRRPPPKKKNRSKLGYKRDVPPMLIPVPKKLIPLSYDNSSRHPEVADQDRNFYNARHGKLKKSLFKTCSNKPNDTACSNLAFPEW